MGILSRTRRMSCVLAVLLLLVAAPAVAEESLADGQAAAAEAAAAEAAAATSVKRWLGAIEAGGDAEARRTLLVAIGLAGDAGVEVLIEAAESGRQEARGAFACWALGQALRPEALKPPRTGPLVDRAGEVLRAALGSPSADVRLSAASALGVMEARSAEGELLDLLLSPGLTPEAEDVLLMSLAGLRGSALSLLEGRLERGGGEAWAAAATASFLRWGGDSWPELLRLASGSDSPSVRATALTSLLLLAEPASACGLAELYGTEPEPLLRRVVLQALVATRHPLARDHLALVARTETDPQLAEVARLFTESLARERERRRDAGDGRQRSVPELLADLERDAGFARHVDEIELRADPVHAPMIATLLRRLPLRGDDRALADHARLAQTRARVLCLDGIDCTPR